MLQFEQLGELPSRSIETSLRSRPKGLAQHLLHFQATHTRTLAIVAVVALHRTVIIVIILVVITTISITSNGNSNHRPLLLRIKQPRGSGEDCKADLVDSPTFLEGGDWNYEFIVSVAEFGASFGGYTP